MFNFDIEMIDHDDFSDVTTVRISGTEDNLTYCHATVTFDESGDIYAIIVENLAAPKKVAAAIEDAIAAELTQHQCGPNGDEIRSLRDLFAVVTPSGSVDERYDLAQLIAA